MPQFRRVGPDCRAALSPHDEKTRLVKQGQIIEAPITTGWGDDPGWEWVKPATEETDP